MESYLYCLYLSHYLTLLIIDCESIINTTAKEASLPLKVISTMDNGHPHGFRWQQRPQAFPWLLLTTWTMDINTALGLSTDHKHHHSPR